MTSERVTLAADHAYSLVERIDAPFLYHHATHD
jgi:hypothetical protein